MMLSDSARRTYNNFAELLKIFEEDLPQPQHHLPFHTHHVSSECLCVKEIIQNRFLVDGMHICRLIDMTISVFFLLTFVMYVLDD